MVFPFKYPFPEFYEDDSEAGAKQRAKQQPKQDKASDRSKKSNEAAAGKDGRTTQKLPSSQKNGGVNQPEMSSNRITDVKNRNAEKPSKQPVPSRKSDVEKQKTRKHDVPSPPINRSDESATAGKKPGKKSYSSPDSRNSMEGREVASTVVLKIRQHCQEGCPQQTRKSLESFQGVKSIKIDVDESQVKVTGTIKVQELVSHLQKKLNREVVLVSEERIKNVTDELNIVAEASGGCGVEAEKVAKVVEELSQMKIVPDGRDTKVAAVMKASNKSKAMSRVHVDNLNDLKNGNADLSCTKHISQNCSVGNKLHHLEKVVKVGAKGLHKEENVSGGREARSQKASKISKADSRVHPVNLDEQTRMNRDLPRNKTRSGINGNTMHHLENSMEGKRQNKVTHLKTFELYCDEEYLEKTRETAKKFEGVELAKIDASKGLIMATGAVDQERLRLYLKENLKHDVLVFWKNDITSDGNKVLTNITGVNYGQVKGDADVVQWAEKLKDDTVRCDDNIYKHRGADGVNKKVKEVVPAVGNMNGAWRKDELGGAYTDINTPYQQNYGVDSQFQWMSLAYWYVSPFSDEVVSCDEQDRYFW